ncbi:N-acyl homoserine lactonase family protein [Rhodoferax sp.]|uniref:N-acyl homoserine lactonase family protein n=1 Tax=Rhodoferax sp. TaxID=50421 RepID=UPI00284322EC|nr:N-acyl homoserine lactonase family protein [Rhodoferax sp.]MDR3371721.1 N-acyl homoserine lactonase family protein [Rhodoferax sp.]
MTQALRIWPLLTATHRYEKTISTFGRGLGQMIDAPILAYLVETKNGRILYDVGCDHRKINDPIQRARYYDPTTSVMGAPDMREEHRLPHHLARLGLTPLDVDVIFIGHLHFDHAGGLKELRRCGCGAEIHVQQDEWDAASSGEDPAVFADDLIDDAGAPLQFRLQHGEYGVLPGVTAISTPGHTAGHMSMLIELPKGPPVLLAGDAADLQENIDDEIAPGTLWQGREAQAVASIRKLKALATETNAQLWPNHDMAFYRRLPTFPKACE